MTSRPVKSQFDELARAIHESLEQVGWDFDPLELARRVARLNLGLPLEDEFSVICARLGKCRLVHKLDQFQAPSSSMSEYQVPDLLMIFDVDCKEVPVLVEVKSETEQTLSLKDDYHKRLLKYAQAVNLPLLIAWKFHGMWTLFDIRHLRRATSNMNIKIVEGMKENLLCLLAGDFFYRISSNCTLRLRFSKDTLVSKNVDGEWNNESWNGVFDGLDFKDSHGHQLDDSLLSFFLVHELEESTVDSGTHLEVSLSSKPRSGQMAHSSLISLLEQERPSIPANTWRSKLRHEAHAPIIRDFAQIVIEANRRGLVEYIFHIRPAAVPTFISR